MKNMLNRLKEKQNKKGFTLVEIIVVLVILAILAAIAIPAVLGYVEDARQAQYIAEARSIYLVVQTEEAKMQAEDNIGEYDDNDNSVYNAYTSLYAKLYDHDGKQGTVSKKTGLEVVMIHRGADIDKDKYYLAWNTTNGKQIIAWVNKNKNVEIESIN